MNKKKVFKIIGIVVLIVVAILLIHTLRNYVIITNLQNKVAEYSNSTNFYVKTVANEENGTIITMEAYTKDNKKVVFLERNLNGEITKLSFYNNDGITNLYTDSKDSKKVQLNTGTMMEITIYNQLETENNWQTFMGAFFAKIKNEDYNGKKCYAISNFMSSTSLTEDGTVIYIEKDTGLLTKIKTNNVITERTQKFDNVDDSIFSEPDRSQYTLIESN